MENLLPVYNHGEIVREKNGQKRTLPFDNIRYEYLPTSTEGNKKVLYVELRGPVPRSIKINDIVTLFLGPPNPSKKFADLSVVDVVGTRIVLSPVQKQNWIPPQHLSNECYPFGWGYNLKTTNVHPGMHTDHNYGYGSSIGTMEYYL